jgi:8-oxo-dGTP pyrophosphatase MutT (NUDIX family)
MPLPETTIDRPTARVLLIDPADRTLLFTANEPDDESGRPFWFPPGGGLEADETHEEAAHRELREETGLTGLVLSPCIWLRTHTARIQGRWYRVHERYFVARTMDSRILVNEWTELELQAIKEYRWWTIAEIVASNDLFVPRRLAELLPPVLAGQLPSVAVDVGV